MSIVNVDSLNRSAITYNSVLQEFPYMELDPVLTKLKIARIDLREERKDVIFERKGGLSAPYAKGADQDTEPTYVSEIGKTREVSLKPENCVLPLVDHIDNLSTKRIISNVPDSEVPDNITKNHPLEKLILQSVTRTVGEDILDYMFHAERNTADLTPAGMVDGFNKKIDDYITASDISEANGNLYASGSISTSDGFTKLCAFVRSANAFLRRKGYIMMSSGSFFKCLTELSATLSTAGKLITLQEFLEYLRLQTQAPVVDIVIDDCLGSGDRWIYTTPFNLELGMNTKAATQFIQVRSPFKDPNWVQFWTQWGLGTRILKIHAKEFLVNDQSNTANAIGGDYRS